MHFAPKLYKLVPVNVNLSQCHCELFDIFACLYACSLLLAECLFICLYLFACSFACIFACSYIQE